MTSDSLPLRETSEWPERIVLLLVISAAAIRLIPLQFLHPLQWDELEYYRATRWVFEGRVPYRDFWEHHTPLLWYLYAPVAALVESPGVNGVLILRWAQIPSWILTFWLLNRWMIHAGAGAFPRWSAMGLAVSSTMLMIPATEYRVESLGCLLVVAGLVLVQRERMVLAGVVWALAAWANLRFAPMIAVAALLLPLIQPRAVRWQRVAGVIAGGTAATLAGLGLFLAADALTPFIEQVWGDNRAERFAEPVAWGFTHRLLVPLGVRVLGGTPTFDAAAIDIGGAGVLLLGLVGLTSALARWRNPDWFVYAAFLQVANLLFIATMKFVYNYHLTLVVVMMVPLIARVLEMWLRRRSGFGRLRWVIVAVLILVWCGNAFASIFRGKELDRAYQDRIMREVHSRTRPGDAVWSGIPWALHREPSYRFWFLPELARQLVRNDLAPRYEPGQLVANPPAAVVFDHNALMWVATVQREIAPFLIRHYVPVWRNLWMPGMNGVIASGERREWITPRDGRYSVYASRDLTSHLWFRDPLTVARLNTADARDFTVTLPQAGSDEALSWMVDRQRVRPDDSLELRRGQILSVTNEGSSPVALIVYSGPDKVLFRQPPPGVTLEGESPRVTHIPRIGVRLE